MTERERDLGGGYVAESDPNSFLFGDDDAVEDGSWDGPPQRPSRAERRRSEQGRQRSRKWRGRLFVLVTVAIVAAVAYLVVPRVIDRFRTADYSGSGTGSVTVTVPTSASTKDIGNVLKEAGVVESTGAFTDACGDTVCQGIQPGTYVLRRHMSGAAARDLILDPAARSASGDLLVPEGATTLDVEARLATAFGADRRPQIAAALESGANLGLPLNYTGKGNGVPRSAEGFLFPATYTVDPDSSPAKTLQAMVSRYLSQDRRTGFADDAAKLSLTPYQALTIASIAQSEAKFAEDMPKVVRTILNRIKDGMPLQFDSTSSYACKLSGTPTSKCIYHQVVSPYNTYTHRGLPPTPIDNPGAEAMKAAVTPAAGPYLYFVNIDAAGHLGFFQDAKSFAAAAAKCARNNWGCAG